MKASIVKELWSVSLAIGVAGALSASCTDFRVASNPDGGTLADAALDRAPTEGGASGIGGAGGVGGAGQGGSLGSGGARDGGAETTGPNDGPPDGDGSAAGDGGTSVANGGTCQRSDQCASANCSNTTCCPVGRSGCAGACVDLATDDGHCGSCTISCPATTQSCTDGHCRLVDGQPCATGAACGTGVCSPFYLDGDKDSYGTSATASLCGLVPPSGYATRNGDCCDSNGAINPGADFQNSIGSCGGVATWDYNCSTMIEKNARNTPCGPAPTCATGSAELPDTACGQTTGISICAGATSPTTCMNVGVGVPVGCR
jgi:hypothetical protein